MISDGIHSIMTLLVYEMVCTASVFILFVRLDFKLMRALAILAELFRLVVSGALTWAGRS